MEDSIRSQVPEDVLKDAWQAFMKSVSGPSSGLIAPSTYQQASANGNVTAFSSRPHAGYPASSSVLDRYAPSDHPNHSRIQSVLGITPSSQHSSKSSSNTSFKSSFSRLDTPYGSKQENSFPSDLFNRHSTTSRHDTVSAPDHESRVFRHGLLGDCKLSRLSPHATQAHDPKNDRIKNESARTNSLMRFGHTIGNAIGLTRWASSKHS